MKKYKVSFWYTEHGRTIVEAKSPKEAEKKIYKQLENDGLTFNYDCKDREYGTVDVEVF